MQQLYPVKLGKASELAKNGVITLVKLAPERVDSAQCAWTVQLKTRFGDWLSLTTSYRNKAHSEPKSYSNYQAMVNELKSYELWDYVAEAK